MIIATDDTRTHEFDRIRKTLCDWGVGEVQTCQIGDSRVLLVADGGTRELAERVQSRWPAVRLVYPVSGSPLAERRHFPADTFKVVAVGDRSAIEAPLRSLNLGPVSPRSP